MAELVIVDTDILIDAGRGGSEAVACLQQIEQQSLLAISVVTQMELTVGCISKVELRMLERFFVTKNQPDYRFITGLHLLAYP